MKAIKNNAVTYKELSKYPAVKRDLALLLDKNVPFADIEKIAYETDKKLLKSVELFDVYEGKKQIDKLMGKLVQNLENKLGAKLR